MTSFVRVQKAWERLGVSRTTFYEKFIKTNRRLVKPLGDKRVSAPSAVSRRSSRPSWRRSWQSKGKAMSKEANMPSIIRSKEVMERIKPQEPRRRSLPRAKPEAL